MGVACGGRAVDEEERLRASSKGVLPDLRQLVVSAGNDRISLANRLDDFS